MDDLTIIYISSNRESPEFEQRICEHLLSANIPVIAVTHKPMDMFSENICVGDVGLSSFNCRKQFLIGAIEAQTKYVCVAESDFLYPEEYFRIRPKGIVASTLNIYVSYEKRTIFQRIGFSDGAIIAERNKIISVLASLLGSDPEWKSTDNKGEIVTMKGMNVEYFDTQIPLVTFKTSNAWHRRTNLLHYKTLELPHWGSAVELREKYAAY